MRIDIEIKYKNVRKLCLNNLEKLEKKGNHIVFSFEDGFVCMERQDNILSLEINMVESENDGRFCCR